MTTQTVTEGEAQATQGATTEPRYAEGTEELAGRVLAAREQVGRAALAEWLGVSQSACWRAERGRIHPTEVAHLRERMAHVDELPVPEPRKTQAGRIELAVGLLEAARGSKGSKGELIDAVLGALTK